MAKRGGYRSSMSDGRCLAERLAIVGDPREGMALSADGLPDIDWVPIDRGSVEIEGRTVTVLPFSMVRYPVIIAQFRAFVDDCYRDGRWHLPPVHRATQGKPRGRQRQLG